MEIEWYGEKKKTVQSEQQNSTDNKYKNGPKKNAISFKV